MHIVYRYMFYMATIYNEISAIMSVFQVHFVLHSLPFLTGVDIDIDLGKIVEFANDFSLFSEPTHNW